MWHMGPGMPVVEALMVDKEKTSRLAAQWALERAENILNNMTLENTGWMSFFMRWAVSDEPLRADAAAALPEIRRAIKKLREQNQ